jgi:hypothetical protein
MYHSGLYSRNPAVPREGLVGIYTQWQIPSHQLWRVAYAYLLGDKGE